MTPAQTTEATNIAEKLAIALNDWMQRKRAKLRDIAHIAKVDEKTVKRWMTGKDLPDNNTLTRLKRAVPQLKPVTLPDASVVAALRAHSGKTDAKARAGESSNEAESPAASEAVPVTPAAPVDTTTPLYAPDNASAAAQLFGKMFKQAREANKMSLNGLAEVLDVHVATIVRWQNGGTIMWEAYERLITLMPELGELPAPVYDPGTRGMVFYQRGTRLEPAPAAPEPATSPKPTTSAAPEQAPTSGATPDSAEDDKPSIQDAIKASPWRFPRVADIDPLWQVNFIVTDHAVDRFRERYLNTRQTDPNTAAYVGHLVQHAWRQGWYEKITHEFEDFFVLALPGPGPNSVFYALLREDQTDDVPRLVVVTILTPEMRHDRKRWDVKLNMPFKAILAEAATAQRLVPRRANSSTVVVSGDDGKPVKTTTSTPVVVTKGAPSAVPLQLTPARPDWVSAAKALAPWTLDVPSHGDPWRRYVLDKAVAAWLELYCQNNPPHAVPIKQTAILDALVECAIRRDLYATFEQEGETWTLVALPPLATINGVVYALVRQNPLEGRHQQVILGVVRAPALGEVAPLIRAAVRQWPRTAVAKKMFTEREKAKPLATMATAFANVKLAPAPAPVPPASPAPSPEPTPIATPINDNTGDVNADADADADVDDIALAFAEAVKVAKEAKSLLKEREDALQEAIQLRVELEARLAEAVKTVAEAARLRDDAAAAMAAAKAKSNALLKKLQDAA